MSEWNYPPSPYPGDPGFIGPPMPFWLDYWNMLKFFGRLFGF